MSGTVCDSWYADYGRAAQCTRMDNEVDSMPLRIRSAVLAAVSGRGVASLRRWRERAALATLSMVAVVTALPGETNAAFPGANGLIAFQTNIDHVGPGPDFGLFEIYVMNGDGSGKRGVRLESPVIGSGHEP